MLESQIAFEKIYGSTTDPDKLGALFAPDATAWNLGDPELKGRDAIVAGLKQVKQLFPDLKQADQRMWTKGNTLVLQWVSTATEPKSGKPLSISAAEVLTFNDDGLVATDHTYFDTKTILEQTGAYKGPKPPAPLLPLPSGPVEAHNAKNDATEQANAAAIVAANAAWYKKDDKGYLGFFTNDAAFWGNDDNLSASHDKKFVAASLAASRKAAEFTAFKDVNVVAVEDFTIDEQEGTFTQKAAYNFDKVHIPNTKKSATTHSVEIDQWKDGKIVKSWNWSSAMEVDAQLGVGPAAPPPMTSKPAKAAPKKP
jgi:ketosteroid isomerase-like protein